MSYLVFARKYRPRTFDEVIGQEHVAQTLRNAIETGRLAHAYLFCGPRGVGKTTMARLLAKAVNCGGDADSEMAKAIAAGQDVDVIEIDAASNRKVEDVEPLIHAARYVPQRAPRKIFIVDEAHMLSKHAWNALLKTLEEPPPHVLFIFATTEPHKVIETVRSRCQRFDFRRITPQDIARKLRRIADAEKLAVEDGVLEEIAARSTGGLRDAETLLDQLASAAPADRALTVRDLVTVLGDTPREVRLDLLRHAQDGAMQEALGAAASVVDAGADPAALLRDLYGDLHDLAVARARGEDSVFGVEWCLAAAELVGRHLALADRSRAPRATLDLALLALARLGDVADLEDMVRRLERLAEGAPAPAPAPRTASPVPMPGPSRRPTASVEDPAEPRKATPGRPDLRAEFRRLQSRGAAGPAQAGLERRDDGGRRDTAPEAPRASRPRPASRGGLSGEEMAHIRNLPRVREVLETFGGHIEEVRRSDDG